jgi:hypothetical protein
MSSRESQKLRFPNAEVDLEVNTEKAKYLLMSRHQITGQNNDVNIYNRAFENVI